MVVLKKDFAYYFKPVSVFFIFFPPQMGCWWCCWCYVGVVRCLGDEVMVAVAVGGSCPHILPPTRADSTPSRRRRHLQCREDSRAVQTPGQWGNWTNGLIWLLSPVIAHWQPLTMRDNLSPLILILLTVGVAGNRSFTSEQRADFLQNFYLIMRSHNCLCFRCWHY